MNKIGIIGRGFVGTAVLEGMRHAFQILSYDKANGGLRADWTGESGSLVIPVADPYRYVVEEVDGPIFVCVPTPMNADGACNVSIVEDVVASIAAAVAQPGNKIRVAPEGSPPYKQVVAIKSTVVPGTTERLNREHPGLRVCFNPEFLTERNFVEDFKNQDRIIIGGPHEGTAVLKQLYETAYPHVPVTKTSSTIAELVKYMTNAFLATKVSFANEMKQLCDGLGIDYDKVVEYATKDRRLGQSHWAVPGPDGKAGFGLTCFPKDLNGLIKLAESLGVEPTVMKAAWEKNLEVRPERDWEQMKGRAVTE